MQTNAENPILQQLITSMLQAELPASVIAMIDLNTVIPTITYTCTNSTGTADKTTLPATACQLKDETTCNQDTTC